MLTYVSYKLVASFDVFLDLFQVISEFQVLFSNF